MIRRAFQHLPGIGPERMRLLAEADVKDWDDLLARTRDLALGDGTRAKLAQAIARCDRAVAEGDVRYLVDTFHGRDHWRILGRYFEHASYFDIETSGLDLDSHVTVIACYHRGSIYTFVHGENMEAFLDLLEEVDLLVSFNGASFDVPRVQQHFHIPGLPCPHLDLRWVCYYLQRQGGLKDIERQLGIRRPADLVGVDGDEAVWLWRLWADRDNRKARERLLRYCAADAVSLPLLAARLLEGQDASVPCPEADRMWEALQQIRQPALGDVPSGQPSSSPVAEPTADRARARLQRHLHSLRQNASL